MDGHGRASASVGKLKERRDDFDRLEQVVHRLVEQTRHLRAENARLRRELGAQDEHVQHLDERLIEAHQLRQDAIKRIDDLLSQFDHLDASLAIQDGQGGD
jgi:regulator of replication initiation timing